AGADSRSIAASQAERAEMMRIAGAFSEEDLTRYLQISLDLFRDLQASLQPRFHLEIGLLKMVQAGRLISVEEALASLGTANASGISAPENRAPAVPQRAVPQKAVPPSPVPPSPVPPSPDD